MASRSLSGRGKSDGDTGTQRDQTEKAAAVQREVGDALLFDHGADGGVFGGEHFVARAHFDGLGGLSHYQGKIDAGRLLHLEFDVGLDHGIEARGGHFHLIHAGKQTGEAIDSRVVGYGTAGEVGRGVSGRDLRVGGNGPAGIVNFSRDFSQRLGRRQTGDGT